jgi:hypothetical protein
MPPETDFTKRTTQSLFTKYRTLLRFGDDHNQEFAIATELRTRPYGEKLRHYKQAQTALERALEDEDFNNLPLLITIEERFHKIL